MTRGFFARHSKAILLVVLLCIPVLVIGSARAVRSNNNQVEDWLPSNFSETRDLAWFREFFASDQFVIISWDGCQLGDPNSEGFDRQDDPRIEMLAEALIPNSQNDEVDDFFPIAFRKPPVETRFFKSVTTGRRVLNALVAAPSSLPYEDAVRRLKGALIGPDGRQTCVVVTLTSDATHHLREAVGRGSTPKFLRFERPPGELLQKIQACHIDLDSVRLGGPPIDNVSIDEEGEKTVMRLAALAMVLGVGLAWWSLRSVRLTAIVFGCGIVSAMLAMSFVYYSGQKMDAILMSMPLLVYVLAMSGAVHLVNYYKGELRNGDVDNATGRAVRHAWKPGLLCCVTTAIGLASLYASELAPIRKFGMFSAAGVIGLLLITFIYLPAALQVFHRRRLVLEPSPTCDTPTGNSPADAELRRRRRREQRSKRATAAAASVRHPKTMAERIWSRCALFLIRHSTLMAAGSIGIACLIGLGAFKLHTSVDLLKLFEPHAHILQDYAWFEQNIGPLVPLEIVVRFPADEQQESAMETNRVVIDGIQLAGPGDLAADQRNQRQALMHKLSFLERAELVALCQEMIERKHGATGDELVGKSMSPVTFTAPLPTGRNDALTVASGIGHQRLAVEPPRRLYFQRILAGLAAGSVRIVANQRSREGVCGRRLRSLSRRNSGHVETGVRRTSLSQISSSAAGRRSWREIAGQCCRRVVDSRYRGRRRQAPLASAVFRSLAQIPVGSRWRPSQSHRMQTGLESSIDKRPNTRAATNVGRPAEVVASRTRPEASAIIRLSEFDQGMVPPPAGEPDFFARDARAASNGVDAVFTGVVPIVYKSQRKLLDGLISSTIWSFLTITPLMMLVCRGMLRGAVVMIPNVLPVLFVFGGMGWLKMPVDIGSMMAASIALGVAVDDTIHYLTWYREALAAGHSRKSSIIKAYRHCASPTVQSALISGFGLSVFMMSTFMPTRRLGLLMLAILFAGCVAELFMLPAILAGPMGRVFRRVNRQRGGECVVKPKSGLRVEQTLAATTEQVASPTEADESQELIRVDAAITSRTRRSKLSNRERKHHAIH